MLPNMLNPWLILGFIGVLTMSWAHGFKTAANKYNREAEIAQQAQELAQKETIIKSMRRDQEINNQAVEKARKDAEILSDSAKSAEARLEIYIEKLKRAERKTGGKNDCPVVQKSTCAIDDDFIRALDNVVPKPKPGPKR